MFKKFLTICMALLTPVGAVLAQTTESGSGETEPIAIPLPEPIPLQEYFPTIQGLTWTYGGNPRELASQIRMLEAQDTEQGTIYLWNGFQGERWVKNNGDGTVEEYRDGNWRLLFNFNAQEGDSWLIESFGEGDLLNHATFTVVSRSEKVEVPYEPLETIHISVRNENLADAGVTDMWFASGLGLVKWTETSIAGPQSFDLAQFINRNEPIVIIDPLPQPPIVIDPVDIFPTRLGMVWEYLGSPIESARRIGLVGIDRKMPPSTYLWEGFQGQIRVRKADDGKIMAITEDGEYLLFDLFAEEGTSWTIEGDDSTLLSGSIATLISRNDRVSVPYGQFGNVVHIGLKPNPQLADAGVTDMWFAPGYGLVKWTEITFAGTQTFNLTNFIDAVYSTPSEPGDSTVVIEPMPIPEPEPVRPIEDYTNRTAIENNGVKYELGTINASYTQGELIEIQYRVTALENEATFKFDSGQQYDFHLINENNETAWVWSANKSFIFAQSTLTIAAGEYQSFFARIGLGYEYIPAGNYTLKAFMPTSTQQEGSIASEQTTITLPVQIESDPTLAILTGTVTDPSGAPVAGLVSLSSNSTSDLDLISGTATASWTTRSGTFEIRSKAGEYTLTVRADGYEFHAQNITLNPGDNNVKIVLNQQEKGFYTNIHESVNSRFVAELATDRQSYSAGDSVFVRYRLTNISGQDLTLTFPSGQQYDLALEGRMGRVWTWSQDKSFIQAISSQTLQEEGVFEIETSFILEDAWVKDTPSFLLTGFLTVSTDAGGQVAMSETEAIVKFALDDWVLPTENRNSGLSASIRTDKESYQQGETVTVSYKLTNTSDSTVVLDFRSGQRYDIVLHNLEEAVWGWSWTRLFTAELGELVLAPQDTFAFEENIDLSMLPEAKDGAYVIRAYMTASGNIDSDDTEAKTRFWLGETPQVEYPPIALPVEPMPTRIIANLDASLGNNDVQLNYRVVNTTSEAITLMFRSGQTFDFILKGPNGEVWRWSDGRGFTDALHAQTLSPGDSVVVQESVPIDALSAAPNGDYTLQGYMTVTADEPEAAHRGETLVAIQFTVEDGQLLQTLTQATNTEDTAGSATRRKGDFDNDGAVDFADFLSFSAAFGKRSTSLDYNPVFDLDNDGTIGFSDFLSFASTFAK